MAQKQHLNLSVDYKLIEEAKAKGVNISEVAEQGIRDALHKVVVEIEKKDNLVGEDCYVCRNLYNYASITNPNIGLTWLYPDEKWICHKCLNRKPKSIF